MHEYELFRNGEYFGTIDADSEEEALELIPACFCYLKENVVNAKWEVVFIR